MWGRYGGSVGGDLFGRVVVFGNPWPTKVHLGHGGGVLGGT